MELFLNLCWLGLLLPAFLLWQWRTPSHRSRHGSLIFVCTLGCVLVLLFPVISASDDLHSISQAMEESKHSFRHCGHCADGHHLVAHASFLPAASASATVAFEHAGTVVSFAPRFNSTALASGLNGRAPPATYTA